MGVQRGKWSVRMIIRGYCVGLEGEGKQQRGAMQA